MKNLIMIFVKNPIPGKVKTRLAQTLGNDKALKIYLYLLKYTREITKNLESDKVVFYSDFIEKQDLWDTQIFQKALQTGTSLGDRMYNAFVHAFDKGYQNVLIIGSDCLELNQAHLNDAFQALKKQEVVLGPAKDGGYYLLGMNKLQRKIFENKNWSTATVFKDTLHDLKTSQTPYYLLPALSDVDYEEDLKDFDWTKIDAD